MRAICTVLSVPMYCGFIMQRSAHFPRRVVLRDTRRRGAILCILLRYARAAGVRYALLPRCALKLVPGALTTLGTPIEGAAGATTPNA